MNYLLHFHPFYTKILLSLPGDTFYAMQEYFFDNFPQPEEQSDYFSDVNSGAARRASAPGHVPENNEAYGASEDRAARHSSGDTERENRVSETRAARRKTRAEAWARRCKTFGDRFVGRSRRSLNQCYRTSDRNLNNLYEHRIEELLPPQRKERFQLSRLLPFVRRKEDFGDWVYRHKVSVSITMGIYIISLLVFFTVRIKLERPELRNAVLVQIQPEEPPVPEEPEPEEEEKTDPDYDDRIFEDVKNRISNANARDGGLKTDRGEQLSDAEREAQELQERLAQSRANYQKGLREQAQMLEEARRKEEPKQGENEEERTHSKQQGNVVVEYDLKNRTAVSLTVAAYQCEEEGRVVVNITVTQNGEVIEASIARTSSNSTCLTDMALAAARIARFNISAEAPLRQKGTITYLFLPQR